MTLSEQTEKRVYDKLRAFDGVEVAGHAPVNSSIASVLSEGEVLADNGEQYSSIQQAVDVSDGFVFVGPGTYYENVVIDKDDFTLQGAGDGTVIDGGAVFDAIVVSGNNITINSVSPKTDSDNGGVRRNAIYVSGNSATIRNVHIPETGRMGVNGQSEGVLGLRIIDSSVKQYAIHGFFLGNEGIVRNCITKNDAGLDNLASYGLASDSIVANCVASNPGNSSGAGGIGIRCNGDDSIMIGNRVDGASRRGIDTQGNDTIIANNRVSDSGGDTDIDNNGTGTVLDGNLTGSAN